MSDGSTRKRQSANRTSDRSISVFFFRFYLFVWLSLFAALFGDIFVGIFL